MKLPIENFLQHYVCQNPGLSMGEIADVGEKVYPRLEVERKLRKLIERGDFYLERDFSVHAHVIAIHDEDVEDELWASMIANGLI